MMVVEFSCLHSDCGRQKKFSSFTLLASLAAELASRLRVTSSGPSV